MWGGVDAGGGTEYCGCGCAHAAGCAAGAGCCCWPAPAAGGAENCDAGGCHSTRALNCGTFAGGATAGDEACGPSSSSSLYNADDLEGCCCCRCCGTDDDAAGADGGGAALSSSLSKHFAIKRKLCSLCCFLLIREREKRAVQNVNRRTLFIPHSK